MNVLVFGTGLRYENYKHKLRMLRIMALVDNDNKKWGHIIDGHLVISPNEIGNYHYDYVIISSKYSYEIKKQLLALGVDAGKICEITEKDFPFNKIGFRQVTQYISRQHIEKEKNKNILILSHDLSRTGAPIALYYMALALKERGFYVTVYSVGSDNLVFRFLEKNIPVVMLEEFNFSEDQVLQIKEDYALVICNTTVLADTVESLQFHNIKIMWWIHELPNGYPYIPRGLKVKPTTKIVAVCEKAKTFIENYTRVTCEVLNYALPQNISLKRKNNKKIVFAMVGTAPRKGLDILLQCIEQNRAAWENYAEFIIVGNVAALVRDKYMDNREIVFTGELDPDEVSRRYNDFDVILCPSFSDTLPISVTQGWMMHKCTIVSDATGNAEYITNKVNGLIFKTGDAIELAKSIQWAIDNKEKLNRIGDKSYELYEKFFSMDNFKEKLYGIVDEII